jgi:hypothetical protein
MPHGAVRVYFKGLLSLVDIHNKGELTEPGARPPERLERSPLARREQGGQVE